ncbi:DUF952 domain-containing protein [Candidatus Nanohalococcus occultus]|uniref:DUF952 domain-containing protein n=1 Tax=Candidatus Nanohalococcus occultus TaxID=2978047 RepID=UPI0039DF945E
MIYHFIPIERWREVRNQEYYSTESLENEGFIHCSKKDQITEVADFKFNDQEKLMILKIDEEKVESEIKYEGEKDNKFPHIYGKLNLEAVEETEIMENTEKGYNLPKGV